MARSSPALGPLAGAAVAALLLTACPPDPRDEASPDVVAKVGERTVGRLQLLRALTWAGVARNGDEAVRAQLARTVLEELLEEELLLGAAEEAGVTVSDDDVTRAVARTARGYPAGAFERMLHAEQMTVSTYTERVKRKLTIDELLAQRVKRPGNQPITVTDDELRARYDAEPHPERPAAIRVRQVLVKTEEEADHVLGEIKARRLSVEEAARRFSAAPEGAEGGVLPWFAQGELPEVFDIAFALAEGQISGVVASNYGFHIFELVAKRPAGPETFEAAKERLQRDILREKEGAAIAALLDELKKTHPPHVDERALAVAIAQLPPPPLEASGSGPDPLHDPGSSAGVELAVPPPAIDDQKAAPETAR